MSSLAQQRGDRPSAKPLLVVGVLLALAATGAALTTSSASEPARHLQPTVQIVVTRDGSSSPGSVSVGGGSRPAHPHPSEASWA